MGLWAGLRARIEGQETEARSSREGQEKVEKWSRNGQEMVKNWSRVCVCVFLQGAPSLRQDVPCVCAPLLYIDHRIYERSRRIYNLNSNLGHESSNPQEKSSNLREESSKLREKCHEGGRSQGDKRPHEQEPTSIFSQTFLSFSWHLNFISCVNEPRSPINFVVKSSLGECACPVVFWRFSIDTVLREDFTMSDKGAIEEH